jgi:hypothetical protein
MCYTPCWSMSHWALPQISTIHTKPNTHLVLFIGIELFNLQMHHLSSSSVLKSRLDHFPLKSYWSFPTKPSIPIIIFTMPSQSQRLNKTKWSNKYLVCLNCLFGNIWSVYTLFLSFAIVGAKDHTLSWGKRNAVFI